RFRDRCLDQTCLMATPAQRLPDEICNLAHPDLLEDIGGLESAGDAGEQVVVGRRILASEECWWPENRQGSWQLRCRGRDGRGLVCHRFYSVTKRIGSPPDVGSLS